MELSANLRRHNLLFWMILGIGLISVFALPLIALVRNAMPTLPWQVSAGQVVDKVGVQASQFDNGIQLGLQAPSVITGYSQTIVGLNGGVIEVNLPATGLKILEGTFFVNAKGTLRISLNQQIIGTTSAEFAFSTVNQDLLLLSGEISLNGAIIKAPALINLANSGNQPQPLARGQIKQTQVWLDLIQQLASFKLLPLILSDLEPPEIKLTSEIPQSTTNNVLEINGTTEAGTKLTINSDTVAVIGEGQFNHKISLVAGNNTIEIKGIDDWGNEKIMNFTVVMRTTTTPEPTTTACNSGTVASQLFCVINLYRQSNNVTALNLDIANSQIAGQAAVDANYDLTANLTKPSQLVLKLNYNAQSGVTNMIEQISTQGSALFTEAALTHVAVGCSPIQCVVIPFNN